MSHDLLTRSATELLEMMRRGDLSSSDLVRATLERIDTVNPTLNAVVSLDRDRALQATEHADRRWR